MKLANTLSAIAFIGAAVPSAHAVSIKDDVVKLGVGVRLQTAAQISDATGTNGQEYRVQGGVASAVNDPIDFYIRRARLYLRIGYGPSWKGELTFVSDNVDRDGASTNRGTSILFGWVERGFKTGEMAHAVTFGLQKARQNPSDAPRMSSGARLFPNDNAALSLLPVRGVGVGYRVEHPIFAAYADVHNNTATKDTSNAASANEKEGLYYGARAEFSFSPEWFSLKRVESYHGLEGKSAVLGLSYAVNDGAVNATNTVTTVVYGIDALIHLHALTAYAEYRHANTETEPFAGATTDIDAEVMLAQLGYAFPLDGGTVIEPALRYQIIDNNTDATETSSFGNMSQSGGSGDQIDLGLNYYMDGHGNKLQLAYSIWEAESGSAEANIIRLQHQFNF